MKNITNGVTMVLDKVKNLSRKQKIIGAAALAIIVILIATVGGGSKEPAFDPEEELKSQIQADVAVEVYFNYEDVKNAIVSISDIQIDGDRYTAKGKVNILNNYGDKYVGKVTCVYEFNEDTESFREISLDIETPTKER